MKKGQVWVETVIYILIALTMIAAVLAFARPKIQEIQDKSVIDQTIDVMKIIDQQVFSAVQGGAGNKRITPELTIKQGELEIDAIKNNITFKIKETAIGYSEAEEDVLLGNIIIHTTRTGKLYAVTLTLDYNAYDITYGDGTANGKILGKAPMPYKIAISNKGNNGEGKSEINMGVI